MSNSLTIKDDINDIAIKNKNSNNPTTKEKSVPKNQASNAPNSINNNNNNINIKGNKIGNYLVAETLGEGAFGKVKKGTHIPTNEKVAIKILNKQRIAQMSGDISKIQKEIYILKKLKHKNIVQLYEIFESKSNLFLVIEFCSNGELFDYISKKRRLSEQNANRLFQNLIDGVEYLHINNIVHRDLKPENLLLDEKINLKLSDFGLSTQYKGLISTPCGTPSYAPPEMLKGDNYSGIKSDIWSCGVILFAMLCGYLPIAESREEIILEMILTREINIPDFVSPKAKDLIKRMLTVDPNERIELKDLKSHSWFNLNQIVVRIGIIIGIHSIPVDEVILNKTYELINSKEGYSVEKEEIRTKLKNNKFEFSTTCYYLLLKRHVCLGGSSISDLSSKAYLDYITNPDNLIVNIDKSNNLIYSEVATKGDSKIAFSPKRTKENSENNSKFMATQSTKLTVAHNNTSPNIDSISDNKSDCVSSPDNNNYCKLEQNGVNSSKDINKSNINKLNAENKSNDLLNNKNLNTDKSQNIICNIDKKEKSSNNLDNNNTKVSNQYINQSKFYNKNKSIIDLNDTSKNNNNNNNNNNNKKTKEDINITNNIIINNKNIKTEGTTYINTESCSNENSNINKTKNITHEITQNNYNKKPNSDNKVKSNIIINDTKNNTNKNLTSKDESYSTANKQINCINNKSKNISLIKDSVKPFKKGTLKTTNIHYSSKSIIKVNSNRDINNYHSNNISLDIKKKKSINFQDEENPLSFTVTESNNIDLMNLINNENSNNIEKVKNKLSNKIKATSFNNKYPLNKLNTKTNNLAKNNNNNDFTKVINEQKALIVETSKNIDVNKETVTLLSDTDKAKDLANKENDSNKKISSKNKLKQKHYKNEKSLSSVNNILNNVYNKNANNSCISSQQNKLNNNNNNKTSKSILDNILSLKEKTLNSNNKKFLMNNANNSNNKKHNVSYKNNDILCKDISKLHNKNNVENKTLVNNIINNENLADLTNSPNVISIINNNNNSSNLSNKTAENTLNNTVNVYNLPLSACTTTNKSSKLRETYKKSIVTSPNNAIFNPKKNKFKNKFLDLQSKYNYFNKNSNNTKKIANKTAKDNTQDNAVLLNLINDINAKYDNFLINNKDSLFRAVNNPSSQLSNIKNKNMNNYDRSYSFKIDNTLNNNVNKLNLENISNNNAILSNNGCLSRRSAFGSYNFDDESNNNNNILTERSIRKRIKKLNNKSSINNFNTSRSKNDSFTINSNIYDIGYNDNIKRGLIPKTKKKQILKVKNSNQCPKFKKIRNLSVYSMDNENKTIVSPIKSRQNKFLNKKADRIFRDVSAIYRSDIEDDYEYSIEKGNESMISNSILSNSKYFNNHLSSTKNNTNNINESNVNIKENASKIFNTNSTSNLNVNKSNYLRKGSFIVNKSEIFLPIDLDSTNANINTNTNNNTNNNIFKNQISNNTKKSISKVPTSEIILNNNNTNNFSPSKINKPKIKNTENKTTFNSYTKNNNDLKKKTVCKESVNNNNNNKLVNQTNKSPNKKAKLNNDISSTIKKQEKNLLSNDVIKLY